MEANKVFKNISDVLLELGVNKRINLEYLFKTEDGYENLEVPLKKIEFKNNNMYVNDKELKDGDVVSFDYVISVCRKVLNIHLWVKELPTNENIEEQTAKTEEESTNALEYERRRLENISGEALHDLRDSQQIILDMTKQDIEKLEQKILEDIKYIDLIDEVINDIKTPKINKHKILIEEILEPFAYNFFKNKHFKGEEKDLAECLLYALDATDAYTTTKELTEEEYFKILIEQMNSVL